MSGGECDEITECPREGCPDPENLNHYHCGVCGSPEITSMMGHFVGGAHICGMSEQQRAEHLARAFPARQDSPT